MEATLFYKELGRLLYAIAAADGRVQQKEKDTLKWVVKDLLVPVESGMDHHGTDQAYITEFEFDVLLEREATSDEAFESFMTYMDGHRHHLTTERRELVYTCADAVAHAFHGVSARELPLLIELHKLLG
jgi:hypothetical protein